MSVRGQVYSLAARERGLHEKHSPHRFERQLCSKRIFALALSQHKELEVVHEHGVHALDIDPAEGEYNNTANTGLFLLSLSLSLSLSLPRAFKVACRHNILFIPCLSFLFFLQQLNFLCAVRFDFLVRAFFRKQAGIYSREDRTVCLPFSTLHRHHRGPQRGNTSAVPSAE